jgi:hypothetical protein
MAEDLQYKVIREEGATEEVVASAAHPDVARSAFEKALFVYPRDRLELRQRARVLMKSKE